MQSESGLSRWLNVPLVYNAFSAVVGANALRRRLIQNHVRAKPGDKVIDIGCGSALALQWLPEVQYIGLDINSDCIAFAQRTYAGKGTFVVGDVRSLQADSRFRDADIVMALGVLHHLDDREAGDCLKFAHDVLKPNGRFVCHEACWIANQGSVSKYIMGSDRGRNIRTEQQYRDLAAKVFRKIEARVDTKPMRIPYVTIVLECEK
jgi:ubiquinone/menaquinone biosynthesis C-methylase UbiE